jgi:hypothetical protein
MTAEPHWLREPFSQLAAVALRKALPNGGFKSPPYRGSHRTPIQHHPNSWLRAAALPAVLIRFEHYATH